MERDYSEVKMTLFVSMTMRRWLRDIARRTNTNSSAYIRGLLQEEMRKDQRVQPEKETV